MMKYSAALACALTLGMTAAATAQPRIEPRQDIQAVAPALDLYRQQKVDADLWARPALSPRDRSIVTVAALVTRNHASLLPEHLRRALDNGVKPAELSEIITHLSFYAGWGNAMSAVAAARDVFAERRIGRDELPAASVPLLPLDQRAEATRAARVQEGVGPVSPGLVRDTTEVLFHDLWLRPGLMPRDRSLVTVSALIAAGQVEQIPYHLGRAMDNGLTREQAGEAIGHLAYYAGWPSAFSAAPVARRVFETREEN